MQNFNRLPHSAPCLNGERENSQHGSSVEKGSSINLTKLLKIPNNINFLQTEGAYLLINVTYGIQNRLKFTKILKIRIIVAG